MRELTTTLDKQLTLGLNENPRGRLASSRLTEVVNLESTQFGLQPPANVISPFAPTPILNWPFPIFYKGKGQFFMLGDQEVGGVEKESFEYSPFEVFDLTGEMTSVDVGGYWHVADMMDAWYLFNGTSVVYRTGFERKVYKGEFKINSGCEHRGRVVVGGFDGSPISGILNGILSELDYGSPEIPTPALRFEKDTVVWSSIGGGDFPLLLFAAESLEERLLEGKEEFLRTMKRNEFGWMRCPGIGEIVKVQGLGRGVMVYGTEGVGIMNLNEGYYGWEFIMGQGVAGRGSIGGNEKVHFFVTKRGDLWRVDQRSPGQPFEPVLLGYREYLSQTFTSSTLYADCVVSYSDIGDGDWRVFIGGANVGFVLSPVGNGYALSQTNLRTSGVGDVEGQTMGVRLPIPTGAKGRVITPPFDLGLRTIKTLTTIALGLEETDDSVVYIHYRHTTKEDWRRSKAWPINREGNATVRVTGVEFMVEIETVSPSSFFLDYLQIKWQSSDNRTIRGPIEQNV